MPSPFFNQSFNIPKPPLTEENLGDQSGRVFIVTGGYSGVGLELSNILYRRNGTVYIAGRSEDKAEEAIASLKARSPKSGGRLQFLKLDLSDLSSIKQSVEEFTRKETRLDVLTNNAGVMTPPAGSKTVQGYELQMGTNCLGPFLFTKYLLPILRKTASSSPPGLVRVTWAGSLTAEMSSPPDGVAIGQDGAPVVHESQDLNYGQSKAGNVLLAAQLARELRGDGIISVAWNPGNLRTNLQRHFGRVKKIIIYAMCHPSIYGAYTELFAGWSKDITLDKSGSYVIPWGRIAELREDLQKNCEPTVNRQDSASVKFWKWCERETEKF
ncbi:hypothetical protein BKA56DRAFT_516021 [Ilyonectria sp. MPI-CAGE-AT-0026]|nr:hypothetical protein BKA56DRAFT_516021 [Ilyonectria sp. MPI-CAGE-AT-0026]